MALGVHALILMKAMRRISPYRFGVDSRTISASLPSSQFVGILSPPSARLRLGDSGMSASSRHRSTRTHAPAITSKPSGLRCFATVAPDDIQQSDAAAWSHQPSRHLQCCVRRIKAISIVVMRSDAHEADYAAATLRFSYQCDNPRIGYRPSPTIGSSASSTRDDARVSSPPAGADILALFCVRCGSPAHRDIQAQGSPVSASPDVAGR